MALLRLVPVIVWASLIGSVQADDEAESDRSPDQIARAADTLAPSLVRIEYTLQYDRSEEPYGAGWQARCASCGRYHVSTTDKVIEEERPVEVAGWLVAPTVVLTTDPLTNERFVKQVLARFGDRTVPATPSAYALNGNMMTFDLDEPLEGAVPLAFHPALEGPYHAVTAARMNGSWSISIQPLSTTVTVDSEGRRFTACGMGAIVTDDNGTPVGACVNDELPTDGSWKGSPLDWPRLDRESLRKSLADVESASGRALPPVHVTFRSPKNVENRMQMRYMRDDSSVTTEWHGVGVLVDESTILVLANLKPDVTARIDRITVEGSGGEEVAATFEATLEDHGAFLATLERPLSGAVVLSGDPIRTHRNELLLGAEIETQGKNRVVYYTHARIPRFDIGWRGEVFPELPGPAQFLFSRDLELVAVPMSRRKKVTVERGYDGDDSSLMPAAHIREVLADLESNVDPSNVPLTEEEENRLAWMGIEVQDLDMELARINNVSELTQDGTFGAVVAWVYDDSPAAAAGLQVGDILLRLHVEGHPKPLDVEGADEGMFGFGGFPWERLDEVPEEMFDQIPTPWPSADNSLNRKLTELGFGTAYTAEVVRDGTKLQPAFVVVQSPPHYTSAKKYESESLGVTVREMTYEVRRYLQRRADEPGVLAARIEPGSRASVAGLKPYELITHVNDSPIMTTADFESAIQGGGELRLSVKRMTRGRVIKIDMETALPEPEEDAVGEFEIEDAGVKGVEVDVEAPR